MSVVDSVIGHLQDPAVAERPQSTLDVPFAMTPRDERLVRTAIGDLCLSRPSVRATERTGGPSGVTWTLQAHAASGVRATVYAEESA